MAGRMDIKLITEVLCSILIILVTHAACQGGCSFRFRQQPNSNLNCNPYHDTTLHITCLAIGPLASALQVAWWFSESVINSSTLSPPERVVVESSGYRVLETKTTNSESSEQLISTTLSLTIDRRKESSLCVWCQIEALGRILEVPSNKLCISEPEVYSDLQNCSQQVVVHNFTTVCVEEQSIELSSSRVSNSLTPTETVLPSLPTQVVFEATEENSESESIRVVMSTTQLGILGSELIAPNTPLSSDTYTTGNTHIVPESSTLFMQRPLATTTTLRLLPTPTKDMTDNYSGSVLSNNNLTALYTAVVVCVLLAAVVMILVAVVLVLCRRHSRQRKAKSGLYLPKLGPNLPKSFHNRSQLSFSGSEILTGEVPVKGGVLGASDIRCGSEPGALKGSIDTRSSGSQEISTSTEKSNSLSRKNFTHKYTEIDTLSHSGSTHSKMSHSLHASQGDNIHQSSGNGSISGASKPIPPPPNMRTRGRSDSSPHFYYILEKLESEAEEGRGDQLKGPWEFGLREGNYKSWSREGSKKNRSGSLKREVGSTDASIKNELCWGDGSIRPRSGSCPSKERRGGSLKRVVSSREGSSKSSRSREGSVKKTTPINGSVRAAGSREGSIKSRGSRDGSFKKEVWVPVRAESGERERSEKVPPPLRDYDVLEPRELVSTPFSIINENYFCKRDTDGAGQIFDDPKYAAVSVGDLPQLANRHQSLDPIIPWRMQARQAAMGTDKTSSSKSLQDSGLGAGSMRSSIYQMHNTTPICKIGMTVGRNTPPTSRLSMPFDAYS